jgi:hypothetical protein
MIGNIFFEFNDIDVKSQLFKSWVDLIKPLFEDWDMMDHRRFLAIIQGGSLPIMSLTALHYYIKFNEKFKVVEEQDTVTEELATETDKESEEEDTVEPVVEEPVVEEPVVEDTVVEEPVEEIKQEITPADQVWIELNGTSNNSDDEDDIAKYNPQE